MTQSAIVRDDATVVQVRLRQFMNGLLAAFLTLALLMTILSLGVPTVNRVLGTASIYGVVAALLVARCALLHRPVAAISTISAGFFCLALVDVVLLPRALPVLIFLPVMAIAVALPYLSARALLGLSIGATLTTAVIASLSEFVKRFQPAPGLLSQIIFILAVTCMCGLTLFLFWQYHQRQSEILGTVRGANGALEHARATLEGEVTIRTADLRAALDAVQAHAVEQARLLDELAVQRDAVRAVSVPVLPVCAKTLVIPLVGALDPVRMQLVQEQALRAIEQRAARHLIVDITGVPVVDRQVAQGLLAVVGAARLVGSEAVLVGVRPDVAQAMAGLELALPGMRTFADLQTAMARLADDDRAELRRRPAPRTR